MRHLSLSIALSLSVLTSLQAFDFTPRTLETATIEGNRFFVQYFENKGKLYRPHLHQATLSGNSREALFSFPYLNQATMRLRSHPEIYKLGQLDAETKTRVAEAAQKLAPEGATLVSTHIQPCEELEVRDIPACEVISIYDLPGHRVWQSATFLTFVPDEPMVMITSAYENEGEDARALALRVIRAWVETTVEEMRKPPEH